jgi:hypothetical protein
VCEQVKMAWSHVRKKRPMQSQQVAHMCTL